MARSNGSKAQEALKGNKTYAGKVVGNVDDPKIKTAKVKVVLMHAFMSAAMLKARYIRIMPDDPMGMIVPTMATDGNNVWYNQKWIDDLTQENVNAVNLHELMHIMLGHPLRMGARDKIKWNVACDYAINDIIDSMKKAGSLTDYDLPGDVLLDPQYHGMTAERIYDLLPDIKLPKIQINVIGASADMHKDKNGNPIPGSGRAMTPAEAHMAEQEYKTMLGEAMAHVKMQGNCPGAITELLEGLIETKVDWRPLLRNMMTAVDRRKPSFEQPRKRYVKYGVYLPGTKKTKRLRAINAFDVSGSVDNDEINAYWSEYVSLAYQLNAETDLIQCDTKVRKKSHKHWEWPEEIPKQLEIEGRGGTDFRPVFQWIKDNYEGTPDVLIYFTDMECDSFPNPEDVPYPVIWASSSTIDPKGWKVPFGQVISITKDEEW